MAVVVKRVRESVSPSDGIRVLVDRLWPRGLEKKEAAVKLWLRELAPSTELCDWFRGNPAGWNMFRKRYLKELTGAKPSAAVDKLHQLAKGKRAVTLLYSSRDEEHNNAIVLKQLLDGQPKPPSSVGRSAFGGVRMRKSNRQ